MKNVVKPVCACIYLYKIDGKYIIAHIHTVLYILKMAPHAVNKANRYFLSLKRCQSKTSVYAVYDSTMIFPLKQPQSMAYKTFTCTWFTLIQMNKTSSWCKEFTSMKIGGSFSWIKPAECILDRVHCYLLV